VIELSGEVDLLAYLEISGWTRPRSDWWSGDVVVDLRAVTFLDPCGLHVLDWLRDRVLEGGGRLRVVRGPARVARVVRLARMEAVFVMLDAMPRSLEEGAGGLTA